MKSKLFANGCFRELLYLSPISPSSSCLTISACQNGLSLCLLKTSLPPKNTLSKQGMQSSSQLYFQYFLILISFFCRSAEPVFSPLPASSTSFATFLRSGQSFTASFAGNLLKTGAGGQSFIGFSCCCRISGPGAVGLAEIKVPHTQGAANLGLRCRNTQTKA